MANRIEAGMIEMTGIKKFRTDTFIFEEDGNLGMVIHPFTMGAWHAEGTFGAGGKVTLHFSNDRNASLSATDCWTKEVTDAKMEVNGDFVEYWCGSFVKVKVTADGFEGEIHSSLKKEL